MTIKQAINVLENYNEWRRGNKRIKPGLFRLGKIKQPEKKPDNPNQIKLF